MISTSYPVDGNDLCFSMEEESFWFAHRNRVITAAVRRHPPADGPIFDVGAGNGFVTSALEHSGFAAIAIEPSRIGAANAVRRGVAHVVCGSLPSTSFATGTAGAIGLFDVIEHIEDDRSYLRSLMPYLRARGRLYITVPAYPSLWSENDVYSGHFRRYTLPSLVQLLGETGYRVELASYFFWCLPLPIFLFRKLRGRDGSAPSRSREQHRMPTPFARKLATAAFSFETQRIERGRSIPFGASCIVVAMAAETAP
jgi:SAM-dependent methyltransferase